ncbi:hypothetical protein DL93DRAFT_2060099 [Clavulina sp. PMI_390]|nr:hypothetical protein DL93DRAFT_2060099 [Clavulina sp. PMI_390]
MVGISRQRSPFLAECAAPARTSVDAPSKDYSPIAQGPKDTNTFLGYSIAPLCDLQPFIPHEESVPGRVYAMTNRLSYFPPQPERAWPPSFFASAVRRFAAHWHLETPQMSEFGGEGVMKNLGLLERDAFVRDVAKSKVLLGVGRPAISQMPYQALCLGAPFINPILDWDPQAPNEPKMRKTQHNGLRELKHPYVHNVHKDDEVGFLGTIARALDTPIPRSVPFTPV